MKKLEYIGVVSMMRADGEAFVRTIQDKTVQFKTDEETIWDWYCKPVKITIEEISAEEIENAVKLNEQKNGQ